MMYITTQNLLDEFRYYIDSGVMEFIDEEKFWVLKLKGDYKREVNLREIRDIGFKLDDNKDYYLAKDNVHKTKNLIAYKDINCRFRGLTGYACKMQMDNNGNLDIDDSIKKFQSLVDDAQYDLDMFINLVNSKKNDTNNGPK